MLTWNRKDTWVCVFDILGFKAAMTEADKDFPRAMLTSQLDDIYETLQFDAMTVDTARKLTLSPLGN